MSSESEIILPIIDSHIHLWPESSVPSLAWCTPTSPLAHQHSTSEYLSSASTSSLLGFIAVEADRAFDADFTAALEEVSFLSRVALGNPLPDQGHRPQDAALCLAIIPWAPMAQGAKVLESYLGDVRRLAGDAWPKVRGFRYLLQDKPQGVMVEEPFIDALKLLGRKGFVFEVAVDQHRRGKKQLEDVVAMIERAHEGVSEDEKVTFILNHLCKPDLTIYNLTSDPSFIAWRTTMYTLSTASRTYIKLSGAFSEMSPSQRSQSAPDIFRSLLAWLGIVLATFGPSRIMFGSDWPVCTLDGLGKDAWCKWREVVDKMCWMASLGDVERAMIFGGTAKEAYGL
ncbi:amidohydrolase family protein [Ophiocordyceps camponoti-floridani]|uniref:Amidohydrolase family protein n=1 Tax=Ophiocordyceps camponoti-floridani TaxID=2030778 RepID=A0A8H4Q9Q6_9HYPO|nr:amidohydrolase family protein [Ophiocordyceps camponoti-floridani]KAF4591772.1 amidohydrolase family protein [Ophiocordyceps camponoti-floridani]